MKGYKGRLVLALVWMAGMWMVDQFIGNYIRLLIIVLGFIAMWSLWDAREKRGDNWQEKLQDIWLCHMLFIWASVEANIELYYREVSPTWGVYLVSYIFVLTVKGSFNNSKPKYTTNYTGIYSKDPSKP